MTDLEDNADQATPLGTRRHEIMAFLVTTFLVFPGLAIGFVGAYGFAIWISQIVLGPPGPPAG